jgi:hypothetical protein
VTALPDGHGAYADGGCNPLVPAVRPQASPCPFARRPDAAAPVPGSFGPPATRPGRSGSGPPSGPV